MTTSPTRPAGGVSPVVEHRELRTRGPADGARFSHLIGERVARDLVRGLGHSVGLDHRDVEGCLEVLQHADGEPPTTSARTGRSSARRGPGGAGARCNIAWWIVGTAVYQVGRNSSIHSRTCAARKPCVQTTLPPPTSEPKSAATRPWMWKSGITLRHRSVRSRGSVSATLAADVGKLRSVSGTSWGTRRARGEQQRSPRRCSRASLDATSPGDSPEQAIDPAVSPASTRSRKSRTTTRRRTPRPVVAAEHHDGTNADVVSWFTNSASGKSGRAVRTRRPRRCRAPRRPLPVRSEGQPRPDRSARSAGAQVVDDRFEWSPPGRRTTSPSSPAPAARPRQARGVRSL